MRLVQEALRPQRLCLYQMRLHTMPSKRVPQQIRAKCMRSNPAPPSFRQLSSRTGSSQPTTQTNRPQLRLNARLSTRVTHPSRHTNQHQPADPSRQPAQGQHTESRPLTKRDRTEYVRGRQIDAQLAREPPQWPVTSSTSKSSSSSSSI